MTELSQFLVYTVNVDPRIVEFITEDLNLETLADFACFWTFETFEKGVATDVVQKVSGFHEASDARARLQIARLRAAWRLAQASALPDVQKKGAFKPAAIKPVAADPAFAEPVAAKPAAVKPEAAAAGTALSAPLLGFDAEETAAEEAAWELERGLARKGRPELSSEAASARVLHGRLLRAESWYGRAVAGLVLLSFAEVPVWCHSGTGKPDMWTWVPGTDWCPAAGGASARLSGVAYLPPALGLGIEFALLAVVLRCLFTELAYEPPEVTKVTKWGIAFAMGGLLDAAMFGVCRFPFRLAFLVRAGLVMLLPNIRKMFVAIFNLRVLAEVGTVMFFFLGTILMGAFVWMSVLRADDTIAFTEEEEAVRASKGFTTFGESAYSMFVSAATSDFMGVILPSFTVNHAWALMWVAYLVLTKVLLRNMVLDTIISQYMKTAEETERREVETEASAMVSAHRLLAGGAESMPRDAFERFARALQKSMLWAPISEEALTLLYDCSGGMTKESFSDVCTILRGKLWLTKDLARIGLREDAVSRRWRRFVLEPEEKPTFESVMDTVLMLNLVLMVVESTYDVMQWKECWWMDYLELSFALAYLGEFLAKISVRTFDEYWSWFGNRFDFLSTWVLLATSLLPYLPFVSLESDLAHYANILRLFRLVKVLKELKNSPTIQFMLKATTRIVAMGRSLVMLMGVFLFFFCGLCVTLFGGLLYEGNPRLEGTEYAESHWYVFNYNDMFMASVSFFVNVLCEFMPSVAEAVAKTSSFPLLSWLVFVSFYVVVSSVLFDLLLAFTVQTYVAVKEETWSEGEEEKDDSSSENSSANGDEVEAKPPSEGGSEPEEKELKKKLELEIAEDEEQENQEEFSPAVFFDRMGEHLDEQGCRVHWSFVILRAYDNEVHEAYAKRIANVRCGEEDEQQPQTRVLGSQRERVCRAAWTVLAGLDGERTWKEGEEPSDVVGAWGCYIQALLAARGYEHLMTLLVLLTFFETPAWCRVPDEESKWRGWAFMNGEDRCPLPHAKAELHLSGIPYLPPGLGLVMELVLLTAVARSFLLQARVGDRRVAHAGLVFVALNFVDALSMPVFGAEIRYTFVLRTALLLAMPDVRKCLGSILSRSMLGEFAFTAQVFVLAVLLSAWIAFTILRDANDVAYTVKGENVLLGRGFDTLGGAVYSMFVAAISESFVDIFLPSTTACPAYGLLWAGFLLLTQVLLLNLVIDTFVSAYCETSERLAEKSAKNEAKAVVQAFQVLAPVDQPLSDDTVLPKEVVVDWTEELARCPRFSAVTRDAALALLESFGDVTLGNFCDLALLMKCNFKVTRRDSALKEAAPKLWASDFHARVRRAVWEPKEAPLMDQIFECVLMVNLVLVVAQFCFEGQTPLWMSWASRCLTLAYVGEVCLKLSVKSFEEYWASMSNRFDFGTTWLLFGAMLLPMLGGSLHSKLAYYSNFLRLLRLLRVFRQLAHLKSFTFMLNATVRMVCAAKTILWTLAIVLLGFATMCTTYLGGMIYGGNPALEGSEYTEKHWVPFNFNDVPTAFFTWFTQLLNEYSPELAEAIYRVSPVGQIVWWVVPVFYLLAVTVTFEILTAFMVELFLALKEEAESAEGGSPEEEEEEDEEGGLPQEMPILTEMQARLQNQKLHAKVAIYPDFQRSLKREYAKQCGDEKE